MKQISAPFPDVEVSCPLCSAELLAPGYEFESCHISAIAKATTYCESCDEEFKVIVGGDL